MTLYREHAYKRGVGWSIWYLEWVTKYRCAVFNDPVLQKLCGIAFEEAAKRYDFRLDEYEIQPDHVHLLVHLRPSMSPAEAVRLIKGYSSRLLFLAEAERLGRYYWKPKGKRSLWVLESILPLLGTSRWRKRRSMSRSRRLTMPNAPAKNPHSEPKARSCERSEQPFRVGERQLVKLYLSSRMSKTPSPISSPFSLMPSSVQWTPSSLSR